MTKATGSGSRTTKRPEQQAAAEFGRRIVSGERTAKGPRQQVTKMADSKGRIALGGDFANRPVIVERISNTEVAIKMARVIPESEAWLYENSAVLSSVRKGLAQARAGELVEGPDLAADEALAAELKD